MNRVNNADFFSQMISDNKDRDSLVLEKIAAQKEHESKQLAEKNSTRFRCFLRYDNEIDDSSSKWRRSKQLAELNKKFSSTKTKRKSVRPYLKKKYYKLCDGLNELVVL